MNCEGCLKESFHDVCMQCVIARHKAVMKNKCVCGKKKRESEKKKAYSRIWTTCLRCLGAVKQYN